MGALLAKGFLNLFCSVHPKTPFSCFLGWITQLSYGYDGTSPLCCFLRTWAPILYNRLFSSDQPQGFYLCCFKGISVNTYLIYAWDCVGVGPEDVCAPLFLCSSRQPRCFLLPLLSWGRHINHLPWWQNPPTPDTPHAPPLQSFHGRKKICVSPVFTEK